MRFRCVSEVRGKTDLLSIKILTDVKDLLSNSMEADGGRFTPSELMMQFSTHISEIVEDLEAMTWLNIDAHNYADFDGVVNSIQELYRYLSNAISKIENTYPKPLLIIYKESLSLLQEVIGDFKVIKELAAHEEHSILDGMDRV